MQTIEKIEIFKLDIPFKEPFVISLGELKAANNVVLKITTNQGLVGIGEASPLIYIAGETQSSLFEQAKMIGQYIKGKSPFDIEARMAEINRLIPHNYTLKSAIDMALYDLLAKSAGLPLYQLLYSGEVRELVTGMTIGLGDVEKMVMKATEFVAKGFTEIKIKLGSTPDLDIERVRAIREAIGDGIALRIDANQGWSRTDAIKVLNRVEAYNVLYCEEPINYRDNVGLRYVRERSPVPIMADESLFDHTDAYRLAAMGACDYFNIKLAKCGGIHNALKIIAVAESADIVSQVGCMCESRFGLTALVHLAVSRTNILFFDVDSCFFHAEDPVIGGIEYLGKGRWRLPEEAGIGADFETSMLGTPYVV